jgi:hypothetical protein
MLKVNGGDIGIGHSNGCPILVKAAMQGANFHTLILINAALDKNVDFPANIKNIIVIHNHDDDPVVFAKWMRRIMFLHDDFLWGEMGNTGYVGDDSRVINFELFKDHSKAFNDKNIIKLQSTIRANLTRSLP